MYMSKPTHEFYIPRTGVIFALVGVRRGRDLAAADHAGRGPFPIDRHVRVAAQQKGVSKFSCFVHICIHMFICTQISYIFIHM